LARISEDGGQVARPFKMEKIWEEILEKSKAKLLELMSIIKSFQKWKKWEKILKDKALMSKDQELEINTNG